MQGRLKCSVNEKNEQLLVYLKESNPILVALCLGLGVTKIQLLGEQFVNSQLVKTLVSNFSHRRASCLIYVC